MDNGRKLSYIGCVTVAEVSKYDLSGYVEFGKPTSKAFNDKRYVIQQYQGDHKDEYTVMEVDENGTKNGMAQLFKNGVLQMSWRMVNGKEEGKLTIYKNGVVDRMTTWESFEKDVIREVVNDESGKRLLVEKVKLSGVVTYRGEYDHATLKKSGWGIEYDENGLEKHVGYFEKDKLIHIKQAFMKAEEGEESGKMMMIEYAGDVKEDNVKNVLNRRPIYMGGYAFDKKKNEFIRSGVGYEINELSGICDRISEWDENGEKKTKDGSERVLFGGWYGEGESDQSIRVSVIDEKAKEWRKKREEEEERCYWNEELPICAGLNLTNTRGIEELIIGNDLYNDNCDDNSKMKVDLSEFKKLKRIEIGNQCFKHVREFVVDGLASLASVKIGEKCFRISYEERDDGVCRITNCPNLRQLEIGDHSFWDFKSFELSNLNSIQSIKFGEWCFGFADFSLKGE